MHSSHIQESSLKFKRTQSHPQPVIEPRNGTKKIDKMHFRQFIQERDSRKLPGGAVEKSGKSSPRSEREIGAVLANQPSAVTLGEEPRSRIYHANQDSTNWGLMNGTARVEKFEEELLALVQGFDSHCVRRVAVPVRAQLQDLGAIFPTQMMLSFSGDYLQPRESQQCQWQDLHSPTEANTGVSLGASLQLEVQGRTQQTKQNMKSSKLDSLQTTANSAGSPRPASITNWSLSMSGSQASRQASTLSATVHISSGSLAYSGSNIAGANSLKEIPEANLLYTRIM